jgi:hypothetical protein
MKFQTFKNYKSLERREKMTCRPGMILAGRGMKETGPFQAAPDEPGVGFSPYL